MRQLMITTLLITACLSARAASLEQRISVENDYAQRIRNVIEKIDPSAIVQVRVDLKKVSTDSLPGIGFGAETIPMDQSGQLNKASIEKVSIRVSTQIESVPDWIKEEISLALGSEIKHELTIQKAKGVIKDSASEMNQFAMAATKSAVEGISSLKWGLWSLGGAMILLMGVIGLILSRFAQRLELSLAKVIAEKIVPALENSSGRNSPQMADLKDTSPKSSAASGQANTSSPAGQKEMADLPMDSIINLMVDCYWTESDEYANYIWSQLSPPQRLELMNCGQLDPNYFSYILQSPAENLGYHQDARYLKAHNAFNKVNQEELSQWVLSNKAQFKAISPLRWDLLPLSLENRLAFVDSKSTDNKPVAIPKIEKNSRPRVLPNKIQIKKLSTDDENFVWKNLNRVPKEVRSALPSLVWLAHCSDEVISEILSNLDARQLASAWMGPSEVLEKLHAFLAPKKAEMLTHFMKDTTPSRNSPTFKYLFEAGLDALDETKTDIKKEAA